MQINIDRKTGVLLGVIVLLAAAVVSLSINRGDRSNHSDRDAPLAESERSRLPLTLELVLSQAQDWERERNVEASDRE